LKKEDGKIQHSSAKRQQLSFKDKGKGHPITCHEGTEGVFCRRGETAAAPDYFLAVRTDGERNATF